jgi:hypothetical protein
MSKAELETRASWLHRLCERLRLLPRLDSDALGVEPPPGAGPLPQGAEVRDDNRKDTVALATEIAERGFQWRDEESRRLADRATSLLSAASVVIGLGTAFAQSELVSTPSRVLLMAALAVYLLLALIMVLVLRPRPLSRDSGYAVKWVWKDTVSLHRRHQEALLNRVRELDALTQAKACMVVIGAALLASEVLLLTLAIVLELW